MTDRKKVHPTLGDIAVVIMVTLFAALLGCILGVALATGIGLYSQTQFPDDASAGSIAIIVIFTAPLGALIVGLIGFVESLSRVMKRRERKVKDAR
ncbi:hypothetical protein [Neorhodopirellula lusitana]|uniref:hypothetical protein n=1 Tax=Neorhodopirellula lusitana TaxID=445327 RepID=UPI00384C2411